MEPTLIVGQRVLVNRFIYHFTSPAIGNIVVFHPPAGADTGSECGVSHSPEPALPQGRPRGSPRQTFIKRIVAGPGDTVQHPQRSPGRQRGGEKQRTVYKPLRQWRRLQPSQADHRSARLLLHDGRQPWGERRQPILGADPPKLDHRRGLRHLLAARSHRHPLSQPPADAGWRARSVYLPLTVDLAAVSSPVQMRRAGGPLPARWSPPRSCSTTPHSPMLTAGPWPAFMTQSR